MLAKLPPGFALTLETPALGDYQRLRKIAGLSPFSAEAAADGLPGTFIGAVVRHEGQVIAMGRVIGDGGLAFMVTDMAVDPRFQNRGVGGAILAALLGELAARLAAPAYVALVADGAAHRLYAAHGFAPVAPVSQGMAQWLQPSPTSSPSPGSSPSPA